MSYYSMMMIGFGAVMVLMSCVRFRVMMAEGLYENYRGTLLKIDRSEQPGTYWARIALMFSSGAAGLMLMTQATQMLEHHF